MVKQLSYPEEIFFHALLNAGNSYRLASENFKEEYGRKFSLDTISRVANLPKKIRKGAKRKTPREDRLIEKTIRENRWTS